MIKWIEQNPQLFGTIVTIFIFVLTFIGWLVRQVMKFRLVLKEHEKIIEEHSTEISCMKEDTKEITKEILTELKSLNHNYTTIAVSVGKLEGWVEAQKGKMI